MQLCTMCYVHQTCKKLCNAAERFVNQDNISNKAELLGYEDNYVIDQKWPDNVSVPEVVLSMFFVEHKKQSIIAKTIKKSRRYVSAIIKQYAPILADLQQKRAFAPL